MTKYNNLYINDSLYKLYTEKINETCIVYTKDLFACKVECLSTGKVIALIIGIILSIYIIFSIYFMAKRY